MNVKKGKKGFVSIPANERFWSKVDKNGANGCWLWMGAKSQGYGQFWLNGRKEKAHRVAWLLTHREIPAGKMACHKCDNPQCVNPDHIFWGTMSDNIRDAVGKGRHVASAYNRHKTHCKRGHPFSGSNLKILPNGHRECRTCKAMHNRNRYIAHSNENVLP